MAPLVEVYLDEDLEWDPPQPLPTPPNSQRLNRIKPQWLTLGTSPRRQPLSLRRYVVFLVLSVAMVSFTGLLWSWFRQNLPDGGVAFGDEEQDTSTPAAIVAQCEIFMRKNLLTGTAYGYNYSFNQPSSFKYSPSQWLWDGGAHQITWTALGFPDLALADLRSMLHFQLPDGRIPQQINWRHKASLGDLLKPRLYSKHAYNDLTQMPVLPYSLRAIYEATGSVDVLRELVPPLVAYFNWWKTTRDLDSTGIVTILHPWESGLDLTPAYDAALNVPPKSRRRPAWSEIYPQLIQLVLGYRYRYSWDQRAILSRKSAASGPLLNFFKVQDIAVNCVYASGWEILGDLALIIQEDDEKNSNSTSPPSSPSKNSAAALAATCHANAAQSSHAILTTLFSPTLNRFVTSYNSPANGTQLFHPAHTIQTLFPLLLSPHSPNHPSGITPSQVTTLISHLTSPSHFWTPYPIPSVSVSEPEYNPVQDTDLLWRGTSWGFTNWFVMEGLRRHGRMDVVEELVGRWVEMVRKGGVWEMYNPETGVGYGAEGLGMSCLVVDAMKRLGRA